MLNRTIQFAVIAQTWFSLASIACVIGKSYLLSKYCKLIGKGIKVYQTVTTPEQFMTKSPKLTKFDGYSTPAVVHTFHAICMM